MRSSQQPITNASGSPPPPARFNFVDHLLAVNAHRAEKVAYVDDAGQLTYGALDERVRRFAAALRRLGIRREERVLLLMHDSADWPVVFLGCLFAGVVPVAVNTLLTPGDYAYMLEHSRAQAAFVSGALLPTLEAAMGQSSHELRSIVVSRGRCGTGPGQVGRPRGAAGAKRAAADARRHARG